MSSPSTLQISEDLLPFPTLSTTHPSSTTTTALDFNGQLNPPLLLREDRREVGSQLWPAGMVLAGYLLRCRMEALRGSTIVELGAGSGLVGLALALASPHLTIHLTDLPALLPTLESNISLNRPLSPVHPSILSWGQPLSHTSLPPHPDIVLAADCVYFEPAFPLLLTTMRELIGADTVCYFCMKKRRRADKGFLKRLRRAFWVTDVLDDPEREVWQRQGIFLYEVRRRVAGGKEGRSNLGGSVGSVQNKSTDI